MQVNYKEWYLTEIYSRLASAIGPNRAAETIIELREHMDESEREFEDRGLTGPLATRAAMDRLGTPLQIAKTFVRGQNSGAARKWSLAVILVGLLATFWERMIPFDPPFSLMFVSVIVLPALTGFYTRRSLTTGVLAAGFVALCGARIWTQAGQVYVWDTAIMPYSQAHETYFALRADHQKFAKTESEAAAIWRKALATPEKGKVSVSQLTYNQRDRSYSSTVYFNGHSVTQEYGPIEKQRFQWEPEITGKVDVKPLAEARKDIEGRLNEVHLHQTRRTGKLDSFRVALNTSVMSRVKQTAPWTIILLGILTLVAWGISAIIAFAMVQFKTRRQAIFS